MELLSQSELETGDKIAWAGYHATQCGTSSSCTTLTQLMPLFYDKAASAAMVKHGMAVQRKAIQYLNPGQIPVTVFDAPLFTISKLVMWKWPETHGERKHVVMMGGLHTEMALWSTFGNYVEGSGWTTALV